MTVQLAAFYVFATITALAALAVITVRNPVYAVLSLVLTKVLASGQCEQVQQKAYAKSGNVAMPAAAVAAPATETSSEQWQQVSAVIEQMRPHLQADGGDVTLIAVSADKVEVALSGNCMGCMMTDMTLAWIHWQEDVNFLKLNFGNLKEE